MLVVLFACAVCCCACEMEVREGWRPGRSWFFLWCDHRARVRTKLADAADAGRSRCRDTCDAYRGQKLPHDHQTKFDIMTCADDSLGWLIAARRGGGSDETGKGEGAPGRRRRRSKGKRKVQQYSSFKCTRVGVLRASLHGTMAFDRRKAVQKNRGQGICSVFMCLRRSMAYCKGRSWPILTPWVSLLDVCRC